MRKAGRRVDVEGLEPRGERVMLRLFVAGDEPNSKLAKENLERLCEAHLKGICNIEVVDVLEHFDIAIENSVLVTPALIVAAPPPRVTIYGNLSDTTKVMAALGLTGGK